eukprot:SAG31_NODE_904_length_11120_cov_76.575084_6_plen_61_part_00
MVFIDELEMKYRTARNELRPVRLYICCLPVPSAGQSDYIVFLCPALVLLLFCVPAHPELL